MDTFLEASPKRAGPYRDSLGKRTANYTPLSPLSFLPKAAAVHPHRIALVHGAWRSTWAETYDRCRRLASALAQHDVRPGDTVAIRTECAGDVRSALRRAYDRRCAEHVEHPPRCRSDCLPTHTWRGKSPHHRP